MGLNQSSNGSDIDFFFFNGLIVGFDGFFFNVVLVLVCWWWHCFGWFGVVALFDGGLIWFWFDGG